MQTSRSGYYAWKGRGPNARQQEDHRLLNYIRVFFERSAQADVWQSPNSAGFAGGGYLLWQTPCCPGKHRVARLMRQAGL